MMQEVFEKLRTLQDILSQKYDIEKRKRSRKFPRLFPPKSNF